MVKDRKLLYTTVGRCFRKFEVIQKVTKIRSSRPGVLCKKGVLKNFAKFSGNTCTWVSANQKTKKFIFSENTKKLCCRIWFTSSLSSLRFRKRLFRSHYFSPIEKRIKLSERVIMHTYETPTFLVESKKYIILLQFKYIETVIFFFLEIIT